MKARKIIKRNTETLHGFKPESGCAFLHEGIIKEGDFVKWLTNYNGQICQKYEGWRQANGIIGWEVQNGITVKSKDNDHYLYIVCRPKI